MAKIASIKLDPLHLYSVSPSHHGFHYKTNMNSELDGPKLERSEFEGYDVCIQHNDYHNLFIGTPYFYRKNDGILDEIQTSISWKELINPGLTALELKDAIYTRLKDGDNVSNHIDPIKFFSLLVKSHCKIFLKENPNLNNNEARIQQKIDAIENQLWPALTGSDSTIKEIAESGIFDRRDFDNNFKEIWFEYDLDITQKNALVMMCYLAKITLDSIFLSKIDCVYKFKEPQVFRLSNYYHLKNQKMRVSVKNIKHNLYIAIKVLKNFSEIYKKKLNHQAQYQKNQAHYQKNCLVALTIVGIGLFISFYGSFIYPIGPTSLIPAGLFMMPGIVLLIAAKYYDIKIKNNKLVFNYQIQEEFSEILEAQTHIFPCIDMDLSPAPIFPLNGLHQANGPGEIIIENDAAIKKELKYKKIIYLPFAIPK